MLALFNPFSPIRRTNSTSGNPFDEFLDSLLGEFRPSMTDYKKGEDGSLTFTIDVPGVKESDISVEISPDNMVTVKGERKTATSSYSVNKSFSIPDESDAESLKADLKDGVLTLTLAAKKLPEVKESKKILINKK